MFRKIIFLFTLLQLCCVSLSFESDFRELAPRLSNYKTNGDFTEIDVELIQAFFNNFRQVLAREVLIWSDIRILKSLIAPKGIRQRWYKENVYETESVGLGH